MLVVVVLIYYCHNVHTCKLKKYFNFLNEKSLGNLLAVYTL